jgi:Flp pilus assembly protein TadG
LFAVVALTATFRFPDPEELIEPSVTLTFAVSASYSIIVRLEVETPLVNVIGVVVPKLVALTVGWVTGLVEGSAPEKVRLWLPV